MYTSVLRYLTIKGCIPKVFRHLLSHVTARVIFKCTLVGLTAGSYFKELFRQPGRFSKHFSISLSIAHLLKTQTTVFCREKRDAVHMHL